MLLQYTILFPILIAALIAEYIVPARLRSGLLLVLSLGLYIFSGTAVWFFLPLSALFIWLMALLMSKTERVALKRVFLIIGLAGVVGALVLFRYGTTWMPGIWRVAAPLGASFFLLEAVSYLADCYNGRIEAEKNPFYCLVFLCFFPLLTAGPIERPGHLIPQFKELDRKTRRELFDLNRMADGAILIVYGLFCKFVIAERLSQVSDTLNAEYYLHGTLALIVCAISYVFMVYGDFLGYSLIAQGIAAIFGISLMDNFTAPFLSHSIGELWRRWHRSLGQWLKDYIYIPLGGSRKGRARKYLNLVITFIVSGLWHGNGLNYAAWGLLLGVFVCLQDLPHLFMPKKEGKKETPDAFGPRFFRVLLTFVAFIIPACFFMAPSLPVAFDYMRRMLTVPDFWVLSDISNIYAWGLDALELTILMAALLIMLAVDMVMSRKGLRIDVWLSGQGAAFRVCFTLFLVLFTLIFGVYGQNADPNSFFYAQF